MRPTRQPSSSRAVVPSAGQARPATRQAGAVQRRQYGDIVDSDEVHPEIVALGTQAREVIRQNLQPTTEAQVVMAVQRFGPSRASKKILNKENEAAKLALETGLYILWRCLEPPALSGANNDFCTRLGYAHRCVCEHALSEHARSAPAGRGGAKGRAMRCEVDGCVCPRFRYIPNTPEEIGEGWLSRRAQWNPAQWSPKCRCGHGSKQHDASLRQSCRSCGCAAFESHFLCVVCDKPMEAHETVVETESERRAAQLPVGAAFFPLAGLDWDVRALVLSDPTGGGALAPPPGKLPAIAPAAVVNGTAHQPLPMDVVPYCGGCGTVFKSATSRFCHKCGQARST